MKHERNWPAEAWHFDVDVPASLSDRYGELISIAGTVALDTCGRLRAPGDLDAQMELVMDDVAIIARGARAELAAVAKLVAFYVGAGEDAARRARHAMESRFSAPPRPAITTIPVPNLAFPGMMVEIEGYAMAEESGVALPRSVPRPGTLRCADLLFIEGQASSAPSDDGASLEMQAARVIERLHEALEANRAKPADVVRLNVYYVTDGRPDDLMSLGSACASGFEAPGPVITFVPLPALGARHRKVEIDAIAMPGRDGKAPPRHELPAEPPWRWPSDWPFSQALRCGDAIFIGEQPAFDPERRILNAGDMVAQTHCVMDRIVEMLAAFDATYDDVMKVGCWYNGGASTETLWRNALVRTSYMTKPGATSTGVPLEVMFHPDLEIQVDIVAMKTS